MKQNICHAYFAFGRTQMVEMVLGQAQFKERQHVEVQSHGLAYTIRNVDKKQGWCNWTCSGQWFLPAAWFSRVQQSIFYLIEPTSCAVRFLFYLIEPTSCAVRFSKNTRLDTR